MKDFNRKHTIVSLCGLNCGLCPMYHMANGCPGCGGGEGNQPCAVARCSKQHGDVEFCSLCAEYPCERYRKQDEYDSFITHQNRLRDLQIIGEMGADAYAAMIEEKMTLLRELLSQYNDGRKKSLFCLAAGRLDQKELEAVLQKLRIQEGPASVKERAALAARLLQEAAGEKGIVLKLRKKPKQS